ncbi:DEAD/DEAH box helicase [Ammoniphilus sp. YIM 78166]|uniref:DEAD/DEAH box helicase n=1 Tax=Ammoniphilus sp. YIM 78166 TaxID=1644106 RepID=UPI00106F7A2B|nr:DEAD/DEAH box helicase [Ammoniphilus sp. YIM 78166]
MITLHGTYISNQMGEEQAFGLWAEREQKKCGLPSAVQELLDDLIVEEKDEVVYLSRIGMARGLEELTQNNLEVSEELRFWMELYYWVRSLAARGQFSPGLVREKDQIYAKWRIQVTDPREREFLADWGNKGEAFIPEGRDSSEWILGFAHDVMDGYVREVINTKISLKNSQLGKLLKFKPFYLHEEWLHRLCMEEHIAGSGARWEELYRAFLDWVDEDDVKKEILGKCCFRLESSADPSVWYLRFYLLQPSGELWTWSQMKDTKVRHAFLGDLAHASALVFADQEGMWDHPPFYSQLTMEEAYRFLKHKAPLLREQGYAVYVPSSLLARETSRVKMNINYEDFDPGKGGLESLLHFDFNLALGDQNLSWEDWEQLVRTQDPLFRLNGKWVELDPDKLKQTVQWLEQHKKKTTLTLRDVLYLHAASDDEELSPIEVVDTKGWLENWISMSAKGLEELSPPDYFQGELRPYQQLGMSWLIHLRRWGVGACLADDMGLGKTIQFLAYLAYCKEQKWVKQPSLLICPTSVLGNWQREIQRFVPDLSVHIHHGPDRLSGEEFAKKIESVDLVITTYSLIQRDYADLTSLYWDGVILDEAQHIKNMASIQTRAIRQLSCHHRIALTGTPIENRLNELWSILDFLNRGFLGSQTVFRRQFGHPIEKGGNRTRLDTLRKLVSPFILRRSKSDPTVISDLPDKIEKKEYCYLTTEQAVLYEKVVEELLNKETGRVGLERKGLILAAIAKLKQICNHPSLFLRETTLQGNRSGKMMRLRELIEEMVAEGDRILLFTQFAQMGHLLKSELEKQWGFPVPFLYGGLNRNQRDVMINEFQEGKGSPLFLLSLKAGGIGLNLTRANRVIHFDRWWNPAVENQATDRAFRIGQTKTVHVHKLVCMGTIEEKIDLMIERKKGLVSDIMGQTEAWITELSSSELRELLALRNQLIEE